MTAHRQIREAAINLAICESCEGAGYHYEAVRVAGEAYDADYCEVTCDWCEGVGFVEEDDLALERMRAIADRKSV